MATTATKRTIVYRDENRKIEFDRVVPMDELRAEENEGKRILSGYATVFDRETVIGNWFREVIRAGAFSKTITEFDQAALWNHDSGKPLARRSQGTLTLVEDEKGLRFTMEIGDQSWARDAFESIKRGDVQGMSFGFQIIKARWTMNQDETKPEELDLREVLEVKLYEISPVTFPQYEGTSVKADTARSIVEFYEDNGEIQRPNRSKTDTTLEPEPHHSTTAEPVEPTGNHSEAGHVGNYLDREAQLLREEILLKEEWYVHGKA